MVILQITIREETPPDVEPIFSLTRSAFEHHPFGDHTEHFIVNALRAAGALTLSLVAEADGKIIGHVAFSPVTISDGSQGWYGLGPISVLPGYQKQGVGKALIHEGLCKMKSLGAQGCILLGSADYYQRFGFQNDPSLTLDDVPQEYFLALPLGNTRAQGRVFYHEAFTAKG